MNRFCQRCGMPVKGDPGNGGTHSEGTKSVDDCSDCHKEGEFTSPEIRTSADMQRFCIGKRREQGTPGLMAWMLTRSIPKMKRWRPA